jgi:hypothetical protein
MRNCKSAKVYVIACEGRVKIGRSANPEMRRRGLQSSTPALLTLVHVTDERDDSSYVETTAHHLLAAKRLAGEWFDVTQEEAIAAVREAMALIDAPKKPKIAKPVIRKPYSPRWAVKTRTIRTSLPPVLMRELDEFVAGTGKSRNEVICETLASALARWEHTPRVSPYYS